MTIKLQRITFSPDCPTYGVILYDDKPLCVTIERPWINNERNISCIPPGTYQCVPHNGGRFRNVWILKDVPNRTAILIHIANRVNEIEGCIAVGLSFYEDGIGSSAVAMNKLRDELPETFELEIINP